MTNRPVRPSKPDAPVGSAGFAHLVTVLQMPAEPARRRRRAAPEASVPEQAPPSVDVLLRRAEECSRSGRIDEAISICHQLQPELAAQADPARLGLCEFVLTLSHQNAGRSKEAVIAGYKALEWQAQAEPKTPLLRSLPVLAHAVARTGDAVGALELLARAKRLLPQAAPLPRDQCLFWTNSGAAHHALGHVAQAAADSSIAQRLLSQFDDPHLHAVVETNLVVQQLILAASTGKGVETPELTVLLTAARAHIATLVAAERHYVVTKAAEDIADVYIALGQTQPAREVLQIGIKCAEAAGAGPDRGTLELRLARIERLAGQYRRAFAHINLALALLPEGALLQELADAHLESSLLSEQRQHWRAALDSFKLSAALRASLLVAQADARAHALTLRLGPDRRDAD